MRILIATEFAGVYGGAETYLRDLLPRLRERGHEVALLTAEAKPSHGPRVNDLYPDVAWLTNAPAEVDRWRPDVCYLHCLHDTRSERDLNERFPTVFFGHAHYGSCISGTKRFASPVTKMCPRSLGPMCLALYLPRRCGGRSPLTMLREYRSQRCRQRMLPRFAAVAAASRAMLAEFRLNGVPDERLHLLPYFTTGQEPDSVAPISRPIAGRVLMVGRLTDLKGGQLLVRAIPLAEKKLNQPLELIVAGDGSDRHSMEKLAKTSAINARFVGWVDSATRETLMRSADVLAVPSTWKEPFGLVGIEAGCVGLPSVAFDVGGISDWLIAGETGELAPADPPTPEGLAAALALSLKDENRLQQLRVGAWRKSQEFSADSHLDRLEQLLQQVLAKTA